MYTWKTFAEYFQILEELRIPLNVIHNIGGAQVRWSTALIYPPGAFATFDEITALAKVVADYQGIYLTHVRNESSGVLEAFIHPRHYEDGTQAFVASLDNPEVRRALQQELEETSDWENWYRHVGKDWGNVLIDRVGSRSEPDCVGESVQEVAKRRGIDPWQAFFDLIQERGVHVVP